MKSSELNYNFEETEGDTRLHEACKMGSYQLIEKLLIKSTADIFTMNVNNEMPFDCVLKYCKKIKYTFYWSEREVKKTYDPNYDDEDDQSLEKPQRENDKREFRELFTKYLMKEDFLNKNYVKLLKSHEKNIELYHNEVLKLCPNFKITEEHVDEARKHTSDSMIEFLLERYEGMLDVRYLKLALKFDLGWKIISNLIENKVGTGLSKLNEKTKIEYNKDHNIKFHIESATKLKEEEKHKVVDYINKYFAEPNIILSDTPNLGDVIEDSSEE